MSHVPLDYGVGHFLDFMLLANDHTSVRLVLQYGTDLVLNIIIWIADIN